MTLYISRVVIKDIRCFEHLEINITHKSGNMPWTMLVGNNSTGKSTLLRCIAIGLCDQSSAAGLLRESDEGMIRRKAREGHISINLTDDGGETRNIATKIEKVSEGKSQFEQLTQTTVPPRDFPWREIFVCGYGAGRGTSGTGDIAGYSPINATYNLFNYSEGLQNPELVLRRTRKYRKPAFRLLEKFLRLPKGAVSSNHKGLHFSGNWGKDMPLRDLADGYKSTILWFTDFIGWVVDYNRGRANRDLSKMEGIILLDELEQHLHPSWQRKIVADLRRTLPNIQFIATTHSELVARSIGGPDVLAGCPKDQLIKLSFEDSNIAVVANSISTIERLGSSQALRSEAFELPSVDEPRVLKYLGRYNDLRKRVDLSRSEATELEVLHKYFSAFDLLPGEHELDRRLSWEIHVQLLDKIRQAQDN